MNWLKNLWNRIRLEIQYRKKLKELRSRSSKFNAKMQVIKIKNGLKPIKKISQQYTLAKYCEV